MEVLRRWWRRPDHYYWLTAMLAARGAQRLTCRSIALVTVGYGIIALVLMASPSGPTGTRNQLIATGISVTCMLIAVFWLRRRWPTQNESGIFVFISSLCIAASCLIAANPLAGMLGCTAFAALAGYIAFFHSGRFMVLNTTVASATTITLAVRVSMAGDTVMAVCGLATVGVVYALVPFGCHALINVINVDVPNAEIDPLTGLLNRTAFYRAAGELMSVRGRQDDRYLVIVLVSLDNFGLLTQASGPSAGDRARVAIAQALRETTRGDAIVAHSSDTEFLIADTFPSTDPTPLIERVRGAVATTPPRLTASIGVVSTKLSVLADLPPEDVLDELIELAATSMTESRRAGGNQARYVVCHSLSAAEDDPGHPDADDVA